MKIICSTSNVSFEQKLEQTELSYLKTTQFHKKLLKHQQFWEKKQKKQYTNKTDSELP